MNAFAHPPGFRPAFALFVLALVLGFALGGCGDDDENPMKPAPGGPTYPNLSHPASVLAAYELAYSSRDTTMGKALFDPTYTGSSVDLNHPGSDLSFTYDDEIAHMRALAITPGLSAYLDLGPDVTWDRLPSDDPSHPEWAVLLISGFAYRIEITEGVETWGAIGEAGTFQEFAFTPTLDSTSPTDTLWKIVRWRETGRSDSPVP